MRTLLPCCSKLRRASRLRLGALTLLAPALLWACAPPLAGVYSDASGATQYEFRPNGTVYISVLGATATAQYEVSSDRVLISGPQGTVVLIRKQGRLQGPMGLELAPRESI